MASNNRIRLRPVWIAAGLAVAAVAVGAVIWAVIGFTPGKEPPETTAGAPAAGPEDIICGQYSCFSGKFVEDGSDLPVQNVAAMLVTNRSDQFLDLATLTYLIDDKPATFVVTGLPPGTSAWVMEQNCMTIDDEATFRRQDCVTSFREPGGFTGEISLMSDGHNLTAINKTDRTLKDVYVYYKALHTDGNFFGGITYRVGFGDIAAGAAAEKIAGHYSADGAQVVRITMREE